MIKNQNHLGGICMILSVLFFSLMDFLIKSLDETGFLQPKHKRKSMIENMRTIFHKMNFSDKEMRILLGIFSSLKHKKVDWMWICNHKKIFF